MIIEDISKLPKWAQNLISRLERDYNDAIDKLSNMDEGGETNVKWSSGWKDSHNLPNNSKVTFVVNGKDIDAYIQNGALYISGEREIVIFPHASNAVYIKQEK